MIKNPEFVETKNKRYKINTDFRIALKCEDIAQNENITDTERGLAIIYLLFGDEGLANKEDWEDLINASKKFLSCGKKSCNDNSEADMDYKQDESYIKVSFLSEYNIDLSKVSLHWWDFFDMLNGLSENAVLSRVRYIRNYDISTIKDCKEKEKIRKQKELVALKKKPVIISEEQQKNADRFDKLLGLRKE